ncbi:MAG TPA: hypothetical protein VGB73_15610 [Pyrinomonadaceae bacterium]|jgi:ElaB/YqjD/DUF883 family membrane-anchored ribosome-binding protein
MAEERNTGLARAPEPLTDTDATKEELQRRMEEARESITQTVAEIKETVTTQYQQVRESISETLDWREQYRRRPLAFSAGALGVGLILGYSVRGAFAGGSDDDEEDYDTEDSDLQASISASSFGAASAPRSYASQPITGSVSPRPAVYDSSIAPTPDLPGHYTERAATAGAYASSPAAAQSDDVGPNTRPSYSSGYQGATQALAATTSALTSAADEPQKPGLIDRVKDSGIIDRFKETKAYDKLQDELSSLGERFVEELSSTARNVVVPALLGKLKDLVGIDLSTQREVAQRSHLEHQTAKARTAAEEAAPSGGEGGSDTAVRP